MKRIMVVLALATLFSFSNMPPTAAPAAVHHHRHQHSRFSPDYGAAHYWTSRYFGRGTWQQRLMLCIAYTESRYELGVSNGSSYGPWEINVQAWPQFSPWRLTHSWRYATWAAWTIEHRYGVGPWRPDCGIQ